MLMRTFEENLTGTTDFSFSIIRLTVVASKKKTEGFNRIERCSNKACAKQW